jgi:cytochrome oxidase Cu insertion factor (SCO1/SenC/PrrC family)
MRRNPFMTCFSVLVLLAVGAAQVHRSPKPQIESAAGLPAPDFTLQDQSRKAFRLSTLRGNPVLLIFYRGYWDRIA